MKKPLLNVPGEEQLAEMLQRCLDAILLEGMAVEQAIEMTAPWQHFIRPQVEAALLLHAMQAEFDPRPGLLPASKKRVLQRIAQEPQKQSWLPHVGWQRIFGRLVTVLAIVLLLLVGIGSGVQLVQTATPEQTTHSAKLALEEVQLAFVFGDAARVVEQRLAYAQIRLDEVDYLITTKQEAYIAPTMANYQSQVILATQVIQTLPPEKSDLQQQLDHKLTAQLTQDEQRLAVLVHNAPESAAVVVQQSLQVVQHTLQIVNTAVPTTPPVNETMTNASPTPTSSTQPDSLPTPESPVAASITPSPYIISTPTAVITSPMPTWLPTVTFTATVALQPTATATAAQATLVPTPSLEIKPGKTPKPKPTQKPPPAKRPTNEPPPQKPTKEK